MSPRKISLRFGFLFLAIICFLLFFIVKLSLIQVFRSAYLADLAKKQHNHTISLEPRRGTIYDRHLRPLAINLPVYSLYANPRAMSPKDKAQAIEALTKLGFERKLLEDRLSRKKYFVWIGRKVQPEIHEQVKSLKITGLGFVKESKRYYPNQFLACHVIGFAGMDNNGLEGLEMKFDKYLRGKEGASQILRDARQKELLIEKKYIPAQDGYNLVLTIDETIQFLAERALEKAYQKFNAKSASIIVMDPKTGEILAFANRPAYNLEQAATSPAENRTNRAVAFTYEPGSVFKIVAAAAALQEGVAKETDIFDCENGKYRIGNHTLRDAHPHGKLTFKEVIEQSSNIGTSKIAQRIGPERFYYYMKKFRFGMPTGIELPGEVDGFVRHPAQWSKTSIAAIPMGQEVTVTPLQLAGAIAAIANDGVYMKPFVVKYIIDNNDEVIREFKPEVLEKDIITPEIAQRVKDILKGVVENGTGRNAQISGISVGGKTGTGQKVVDGLYSHSKFFSSFIGFAPVEDPQLVCIVSIDEPHPSYYGGTVAAPAFQEVVSNSLRYLNTLSKR